MGEGEGGGAISCVHLIHRPGQPSVIPVLEQASQFVSRTYIQPKELTCPSKPLIGKSDASGICRHQEDYRAESALGIVDMQSGVQSCFDTTCFSLFARLLVWLNVPVIYSFYPKARLYCFP